MCLKLFGMRIAAWALDVFPVHAFAARPKKNGNALRAPLENWKRGLGSCQTDGGTFGLPAPRTGGAMLHPRHLLAQRQKGPRLLNDVMISGNSCQENPGTPAKGRTTPKGRGEAYGTLPGHMINCIKGLSRGVRDCTREVSGQSTRHGDSPHPSPAFLLTPPGENPCCGLKPLAARTVQLDLPSLPRKPLETMP